MLIICPKCFTRFEVDNSLIKKQMQKFKCSNCGELFEEHFTDVIDLTKKVENSTISTQTPLDFVAAAEVNHKIPEEFTPVFEHKKKSYTGLLTFIVFVLVAFIGAYGYFNRSEILGQFPNVEKGMDILTSPEEVPVAPDALSIYPAAQTPQSEQMKEVSAGLSGTQDVASEDVLTSQNVSGVVIPAEPILGGQAAPEMLGDGVLEDTTATQNIAPDMVNDKPSLPAPQAAGTAVIANAPVQIKDVVFRYDDTGTGIGRLFVQGVVNNTTDTSVQMPALQAQLYDKDNGLLGVRDLPYTPRSLNGKMAEFFFAEVDQLPTGIVDRVLVVIKGK